MAAASKPVVSGPGPEDTGVPKWVWGLVIGVPVAAALGYILFGPSGDKKRSKKSKDQAKSQPGSVKQESHGAKKPETVEVEDVPDDDEVRCLKSIQRIGFSVKKLRTSFYRRVGRWHIF